MDKLTRPALDTWLQALGRQMQTNFTSALPGDAVDAIAGEVEVVEPQVADADLRYFHDRVQQLVDQLAG